MMLAKRSTGLAGRSNRKRRLTASSFLQADASLAVCACQPVLPPLYRRFTRELGGKDTRIDLALRLRDIDSPHPSRG